MVTEVRRSEVPGTEDSDTSSLTVSQVTGVIRIVMAITDCLSNIQNTDMETVFFEWLKIVRDLSDS